MKRFKNILCVVDSGNISKTALDRAVLLAENNQASLTIVEVIEPVSVGFRMPSGSLTSAELQSALEHEHTRKLELLIAPYRARIEISAKTLTGIPFLETVREVLRNGHDLLIKTPETQSWLDRLFGSDDMHLLRKCPCPVWLIKAKAPKSYRRILAAVDVDDAYPPDELKTRQALNRQVLEMASSLALSDFSELHIVHVWRAIGEDALRGAFMGTPEDQIADYVRQVKQNQEACLHKLVHDLASNQERDTVEYLKPQTHLIKGWAREEIPLLAKRLKADLVVMGTVARTGVPGFIMGNTAETILNQLDCSVLAIKPPSFVTPVTLGE